MEFPIEDLKGNYRRNGHRKRLWLLFDLANSVLDEANLAIVEGGAPNKNFDLVIFQILSIIIKCKTKSLVSTRFKTILDWSEIKFFKNIQWFLYKWTSFWKIWRELKRLKQQCPFHNSMYFWEINNMELQEAEQIWLFRGASTKIFF